MRPSYGDDQFRRLSCSGGEAVVCILVRMNVRTNLLLPEKLVREVDKYAGPRGRSRFVAEALEAKLKRERLRVAIQETAGALDMTLHPEWATSEDVVEWVRAGRSEETMSLADAEDGDATPA